MWILVIEDDQRLGPLLKRGLEAGGYTVDLMVDGAEGEEHARMNSHDALVVDWGLPSRNGRVIIENLRAAGYEAPILMLTALDDVDHRVAGLDAGADDYLAKPFSFEELHARLRALLRRPRRIEDDQILRFGAMVMDTDRRQVTLGSEPLLLRPKEYAVLEVMMRHPDTVHSRTALAERVWGSALYVSDNVIDVTFSGLRHKLKDGPPSTGTPAGVEIVTVRGVGYRLRVVEVA
ncbi:MAG: two-component system copper resistance phosphate regulon response regulator CusR [Rhodothermales bacterium]|jgi:two-component system copper resistance phosphate regulon response regulator CusR